MRTILITGATSGFGYHMVREFLRNGDRVIATGRNLTGRPQIFARERADSSDRLIELDLDVTSTADIENAAAFLRKKSWGLQVLVNNAGYGLFGPLEELTEQQIRRQFEVNFMGVAFVTQKFLPALREGRGVLFNLSSTFGFTGFPLSSVYCASKFAVEGLSESLDYELSAHGVRVCIIEPGGYRTGFNPNAVTAARALENGPYRAQSRNFSRLREKMSSRKKFQDPVDVARGIVALSKKEKIPLRVPFGRDSRASRMLRSVLPGSVYRRLTSAAYARLLNRSETNDRA